MKIYFETDLLKLNVTPLQALVLSLVDNIKESDNVFRLSHKEIAELLNIARPNVSRCITALCEAGCLEKIDGGRGIKMIPNVYQNDTKEMPKRYQNDTKRYQNDTKRYQNDTMYQNDTKEKEKEVEKETKKEKESIPPLTILSFKEKEINKEKEEESEKEVFLLRNARAKNENEGEEKTSNTVKAEIIASPNVGGARARELNILDANESVKAVEAHAQIHGALLEQFCMNNRITPAVFAQLANEIKNEWQIMEVSHANEIEARRHFFNTMRIKAAQLRKKTPQAKTTTEMMTEIIDSTNRVTMLSKKLDEMNKDSFIGDLL